MQGKVPTIFDNARRAAAFERGAKLREKLEGAAYLFDAMSDEVIDRMGFMRIEPVNAAVIGKGAKPLHRHLMRQGIEQVSWQSPNLERPHEMSEPDFIACLGELDTVNDLPGSLIHLHRALAPGGIIMACFIGAPSLAKLRQVMLSADADRPAPRIHPQVDIRAAAELIQRAGWSDPVVDSHSLTVRFSSFHRLVSDLREHGMGNVLATRTPYLGKAGYQRALAAFSQLADADGKLTEHFEIITLTGSRR